MVFRNKKDKFAVLMGSISANLRESAQYFAEYKLTDTESLKAFSLKMKEYETKGDTLVHEMITELNDAFITPIEREDLLTLVYSLDDVLDGLEHCAYIFDVYSITQADEYMYEFVEAIRKCTIEIEQGIDLMFHKKLPSMRPHAIKIKEYEEHCDHVSRNSIKKLFEVEKDPIRLIKYKEVYENLEDIADDCQTIANIFETIIMKNA